VSTSSTFSNPLRHLCLLLLQRNCCWRCNDSGWSAEWKRR
jgi:hypothetical protein